MTNPNDPAFAGNEFVPLGTGDPSKKNIQCVGLTKREYFAAMAMQGMMSLEPPNMMRWADPKDGTVGDWVALNSVQIADCLIAVLNQEAKS